MSSNTNVTILTGRLGRDPELITKNVRVPFAILNLAINKKWKKDGEIHKRTNWIKVKLNNTKVIEHLHKGDPITVVGELTTSIPITPQYANTGECRI